MFYKFLQIEIGKLRLPFVFSPLYYDTPHPPPKKIQSNNFVFRSQLVKKSVYINLKINVAVL